MVHTVSLELLWLFSRAEKRHEFPSFGHRHCADAPLPAPGVSKETLWCVLYCSGTLPSCYMLLSWPSLITPVISR